MVRNCVVNVLLVLMRLIFVSCSFVSCNVFCVVGIGFIFINVGGMLLLV